MDASTRILRGLVLAELAGGAASLWLWDTLLLLRRPARLLYTVAAAAGLAITPLFGPTVEPTWVGTLFDLGTMSSGAILALLYLSPAARHFGRAPTEPAGAPAPRNEGSYMWQAARCEGDADPDGCAFLQETVQKHCHPNAESL